MPSRKLEDLDPRLQLNAQNFLARLRAEGIPVTVTCTYRSQEEQDALYASGRTKKGPILTKAQHSKHTDSLAFDLCLLDPAGRPIWAASAYYRVGKIGQECGLRWGGDWDGDGQTTDERFVDMPHFELKEV